MYFYIVYNAEGCMFSSPEPKAPGPSASVEHLYLRKRLADQSQILCGASLGWGNEILFAASGSHDQDGRHAHIW